MRGEEREKQTTNVMDQGGMETRQREEDERNKRGLKNKRMQRKQRCLLMF